MKITKTSKKLVKYFLDNKCIIEDEITKKTNHIVLHFFEELKKANQYIYSLKKMREEEGSFYKLHIKKITTVSQIPKPKTFNANSFPIEVRNKIDNESNYHLSYSFSLFQREIHIHFVVEETNVELFPEKYNQYVDKILTWLYIVNEYAATKCSKNLTLFLYMTSLKKCLPESNIVVLDQIHVNTAFTYTCPINSEIVVFREEEWFKVFMHETFHNFALDFSDMNTQEKLNRDLLSLFPIDSEVNSYEAYTEFWAEIWNAIYCSFYLLGKDEKRERSDFLKNFEFFINLERTYSFFQMVKVLDFMGLKYTDLYSENKNSLLLRKNLYKEKSNVLSYYILKTILLYNYQGFLSWCKTNNFSLLQFKKTDNNLNQFYLFIERNYKTRGFLEGVECMEDFLRRPIKKEKNLLIKNMRMTICELG